MIAQPDLVNWSATGATGSDISILSRQSFRLAPRGFANIAMMTFQATPPFDAEALEIRFVAGCRGAPPYVETFLLPGHELRELFQRAQDRMADVYAKANTNWQDYSRRFFGIRDPAE
jgi:hypothetical protein